MTSGPPPIHSLTHSPTYSLTHSLTHPPTHSPTHSLIHSITHSLNYSEMMGGEGDDFLCPKQKIVVFINFYNFNFAVFSLQGSNYLFEVPS